MYRHSVAKKTFILLFSLMLLSAALLSACAPEIGDFVYPVAPSKGEVTSNGGIAVGYGDYIYFVNGYVSDATAENKYTGKVKNGDIVRIKKSDLDEIVKINDEDLTSAKKTEQIADAVFKKVEVVVPMFYYSGNTTDTSVTGIYIFGDKLYYTTPNTSLSASGAVLNSQLCVYRTDLDGKNNTKLYTFTTNKLVVSLMEKDGAVHAVYVETDKGKDEKNDIGLYTVALDKAGNTAKLISKDVAAATFDPLTLSAYYVNSEGAIASYTVGDAEEKVLLAEVKNITYTIKSVNQGYVYFTKADSTNTAAQFGLLTVKAGMDEPKKILDTTSGTYLGYGEKVIMTGSTFDSTPTIYQLILTSGDASTIKYVLPANFNDSAITLTRLAGDILYYTVNNILYSIDLTEIDQAADTVKELASSPAAATGWGAYDILEGTNYVFSFSSGSTVVTEYKEVAGKKTNVTTIVTSVYPEEDEK